MKIDVMHPSIIVPWEHETPRTSYITRMCAGNWNPDPGIPVIATPEDLRDLGQVMVFNGHHRRASALHAGLTKLHVRVLENDEDLLRIQQGDEGMYRNWRDLYEAANFIAARVRRFHFRYGPIPHSLLR